MSIDRSHCPKDINGNDQQFFSPVAPPEYCNQVVHQVSEPSSLVLVLVAMGVLVLTRRREKKSG